MPIPCFWLRQWSVCLLYRRPGFCPWVWKILWRRKWQPTPALLLENPMDGGAWWAQPKGSQRVGHDWATSLHFTFTSPCLLRIVYFIFLFLSAYSRFVMLSVSDAQRSDSVMQIHIAVVLVAKLCLSLLRAYGLVSIRLLCPWDFPAWVLDWVPIPFSRGSSWSRDGTRVSCIGRWIPYHWVTRGAPYIYTCSLFFRFFFHIGYYRVLSRVPVLYTSSLLVI